MKREGNRKKEIVKSFVVILLFFLCLKSNTAYAASYTIAHEYDGLSADTKANCVAFARYKVPSLPGGLNTLNDKRNIINSKVAKAGVIAITSGSTSYGHVAYVETVNGNQITTLNGGYDAGTHIERITGTESEQGILGYWYPANVQVVNNPVGCIDAIEGRENAVCVSGWAYDADNVSQALEIHVYIGGPAGVGEYHRILADQYRSDVNNVYGVGNYHGFLAEISTSLLGNQEVYIYAINIGSGENLFMGAKSVTIKNKEKSEFQIEDGVLVGYTGDGGDVVIPDGVIKIGNEAFSGCSSLTSVKIPEGVTSIGAYAFSDCSSLTSVKIPDSVTDIGVYAFSGCNSLTSVKIPESVSSMGVSAFERCSSLTSINIPDSLTFINNGVFDGCTSLTSITIPDNVTSIGAWAFSGCSNLTSITIPDSVTGIGPAAFSGCSKLSNVTISDSVTSIGGDAFTDTPWIENKKSQSPLVVINHILIDGKTASGDVVIPDSVTSIGSDAFCGCSGLVSVTIPDSVTRIGQNAFYGCTSLTTITMPDSIANIWGGAFQNCINLTNIKIPEGLTRIWSYTFYSCSSLTNITIPDSVTDIGDHAFSRCGSLTSVKIPDSVTNIGSNAFSLCDSLASITVPGSVTNIEGYAFASCANDLVIFVEPGSYAETYAKNDGIPYRYIEENKHTHSYQSQTTTQPGCTTAGVKTFTCSGCGDSYTETIPVAGHKYTKATQNPTCTAKGFITYACSVCNHSYKEEIAALGHKYTKTTKNPTCTEKGAVICTCSVCKHKYTEKTLPAAGHKYVTTTTAAVMGKNGAVTTTCKVCKKKSQTIIYAPRTVTLAKQQSVYNGRQQTPNVTVKDSNGKILNRGKDYTLSYQKDMKSVGSHDVTVSFKENYRGIVKLAYVINPKGTSVSKATSRKKGFNLKWKKQEKEISGYEVAYSTSNKFTPKSTKIIAAGKGKVSKSITGLKAKKKYYVRIRTYKTVKGRKYYSDWSKVKGVRTKR